MQEAVSAVIAERSRHDDRMTRAMAASLAGHLTIVAVIGLAPPGWWSGRPGVTPREVMYVSLGGTPGPRSGGMTPIDARPIQRVVPLPDIKRPEPVRPPAPKPPAMTVPEPKARPLRTSPPTTGAEERTGTARA
jgi:hypothetical protein